ncbi:MAG: hypothetical protein U1F20_03325 [Lysobacterales bacterium]
MRDAITQMFADSKNEFIRLHDLVLEVDVARADPFVHDQMWLANAVVIAKGPCAWPCSSRVGVHGQVQVGPSPANSAMGTAAVISAWVRPAIKPLSRMLRVARSLGPEPEVDVEDAGNVGRSWARAVAGVVDPA